MSAGRAVVTGASRGVGAALLKALQGDGWEAAGTSTRGGAGLIPLDLLDPDPGPLRDAAGDRLDLLVCNAGVLLEEDGERLEDGFHAALWDRTFRINVTGAFLCVQACLPALRAARGRVMIISSQLGSSEVRHAGRPIYRASKAAASNLAVTLSQMLAGEVAVAAYHPGWVRTDMGGTRADIAAGESAAGLLDRAAELGPETSGGFYTWDGRPHPF
ncbi:NADP-dependent 3-hydroxy acid dehydrogenase YdfG [Hasllibacter halocynthiae]|uniref:NADP-dependent 3-hydroxy acid dehydrogenase YdfG n=1 Tax=Hasllibacter halocynthiae TaxID=595589 RepID=A0A2T0X669_9RHOB|nr:SDR family NAD(P)-dependent oxidoreductase [Hasllibacter halocynthiae]PRY94438.1 NADP-dependent 3-hydroxy acid dehydrogenase YdfG [Hasllibacter halocynthiae]